MEEWKVYKVTHPQWKVPTVYEISNLGRLRINGVISAPKKYRTSGYLYVHNKLLHRIVAELFIPNPNNKPEVDHINTIATDNRACNLRWVTRSENCTNVLTTQHRIDALRTHYKSEENRRRAAERAQNRKRRASIKWSEEARKRHKQTMKEAYQRKREREGS